MYMNTGAQPPFMTGEEGDGDSVSDWFRALYGPDVCLVEPGILSVLGHSRVLLMFAFFFAFMGLTAVSLINEV